MFSFVYFERGRCKPLPGMEVRKQRQFSVSITGVLGIEIKSSGLVAGSSTHRSSPWPIHQKQALCHPGWFWTSYVGKDDLELLTLPPPPPECWGLQACTTPASLCGNGDQTRDSQFARLALTELQPQSHFRFFETSISCSPRWPVFLFSFRRGFFELPILRLNFSLFLFFTLQRWGLKSGPAYVRQILRYQNLQPLAVIFSIAPFCSQYIMFLVSYSYILVIVSSVPRDVKPFFPLFHEFSSPCLICFFQTLFFSPVYLGICLAFPVRNLPQMSGDPWPSVLLRNGELNCPAHTTGGIS